MNGSLKWIALVGVVLVVGVVVWCRRASPPPIPGPVSGANPEAVAKQSGARPVGALTATPEALQSAASALVTAQTAAARVQALAHLRAALATGNTNDTSAAIRRFLDSKLDAITGLAFKIGGHGSLTEAPTLRTFLLDQLEQLDPAAAAAYARKVLNTSRSPDEWAVAFRNLARGDTGSEARALLATKTAELLRNESWQQDPSVGYLEAFDTAVYLGGTNLLSPLSDLVRKKDNPAVAHAAFLTLDRLAINQPAETLAALSRHPEWMSGREETCANYFARADVGDAAQRQLVEAYLLNTSRTPAELQSFAGVFPNANFMISKNLLTDNATLDGTMLRQRDRTSLEVVTQWLADPRFEQVRQPLTTIQQRLQEFTRQAK